MMQQREPISTMATTWDISGLSNDDVAIVIIEAEGMIVSGHAKRDPRDKPNPDLGTQLALGRAVTKLGNRLQRQARGQIKHADDVAAYKAAQKERGDGTNGPSRATRVRVR